MIGTDHIDWIYGTKENNILTGGGGNDNLYGRGGNDVAYLGKGDDFFDEGVDWGGPLAGEDQVYGGEGKDIISTGGRNDILDGGAGNDELYGEWGDDVLDGGAGSDKIVGGKGNDSYLFGRSSGIGNLIQNFSEDGLQKTDSLILHNDVQLKDLWFHYDNNDLIISILQSSSGNNYTVQSQVRVEGWKSDARNKLDNIKLQGQTLSTADVEDMATVMAGPVRPLAPAQSDLVRTKIRFIPAPSLIPVRTPFLGMIHDGCRKSLTGPERWGVDFLLLRTTAVRARAFQLVVF